MRLSARCFFTLTLTACSARVDQTVTFDGSIVDASIAHDSIPPRDTHVSTDAPVDMPSPRDIAFVHVDIETNRAGDLATTSIEITFAPSVPAQAAFDVTAPITPAQPLLAMEGSCVAYGIGNPGPPPRVAGVDVGARVTVSVADATAQPLTFRSDTRSYTLPSPLPALTDGTPIHVRIENASSVNAMDITARASALRIATPAPVAGFIAPPVSGNPLALTWPALAFGDGSANVFLHVRSGLTGSPSAIYCVANPSARSIAASWSLLTRYALSPDAPDYPLGHDPVILGFRNEFDSQHGGVTLRVTSAAVEVARIDER